jgi:hypothetical protein
MMLKAVEDRIVDGLKDYIKFPDGLSWKGMLLLQWLSYKAWATLLLGRLCGRWINRHDHHGLLRCFLLW